MRRLSTNSLRCASSRVTPIVCGLFVAVHSPAASRAHVLLAVPHGTALMSRRFAASQQNHHQRAAPASRAVDHYQRLGVGYDATPTEIKAAYRTRALECHPDVVEPHKRGEAEVLFRGCAESFEVLFNPTTRQQHDKEIGVEEIRRRRQIARQRRSERGAAATWSESTKAGYRTSSFASAFARDTETEEEKIYYESMAHTRGRRSRRSGAASAADARHDAEDGATTPPSTAMSGKTPSRRRKPFVRGDADRVFREAFEGKSLDQILFDAQRRRRQAAATSAASQAVAAARDGHTTSASSSSVSSSSTRAGREEVLRRVMDNAAERYAQKIERQYGPGMLQHIQARRAPWEAEAAAHTAAPPSGHLPFRPFLNTVVPEGVSTPELPTLGPLGSAADGSIAAEDVVLSAAHDKAAREELEKLEAALKEATSYGHVLVSADIKKRLAERRKELGLLHYTLADGTLLTGAEALNRSSKRIEGAAHNMGQLYSFHRPY